MSISLNLRNRAPCKNLSDHGEHCRPVDGDDHQERSGRYSNRPDNASGDACTGHGWLTIRFSVPFDVDQSSIMPPVRSPSNGLRVLPDSIRAVRGRTMQFSKGFA